MLGTATKITNTWFRGFQLYILIVDSSNSRNVFVLFDRKQLETRIWQKLTWFPRISKGKERTVFFNRISHPALLDLDDLDVSQLIELRGRIQFWPSCSNNYSKLITGSREWARPLFNKADGKSTSLQTEQNAAMVNIWNRKANFTECDQSGHEYFGYVSNAVRNDSLVIFNYTTSTDKRRTSIVWLDSIFFSFFSFFIFFEES